MPSIYIIVIIPNSLKPLANRIYKSLDPDSYGDQTWGGRDLSATGEAPATYAAVSQPPVMDFSQDAETLYATISADYATRWPDLECPTLAEVEQFLADALIYHSTDIEDALADAGLQFIVPAGEL